MATVTQGKGVVEGEITLSTNRDPEMALLYNTQVVGLKAYTDFILGGRHGGTPRWQNMRWKTWSTSGTLNRWKVQEEWQWQKLDSLQCWELPFYGCTACRNWYSKVNKFCYSFIQGTTDDIFHWFKNWQVPKFFWSKGTSNGGLLSCSPPNPKFKKHRSF